MVHLDFTDLESLQAESVDGSRLGFAGKQVIHPNQIPIVNDAFLPTEDEVFEAYKIVKMYLSHIKYGEGAFQLDGTHLQDSLEFLSGKMVDLPIAMRAAKVLQKDF